MLRRSAIATATLGLSLALFVPPVAAQDGEAAVVYPCADGETFTVEEGQPIVLFCGWFATSKGLLVDFRTAHVGTYVLMSGGQETWSLGAGEVAAHWSAPYQFSAAGLGLACVHEDVWVTGWEFQLGTLDPGTYTLVSDEWLTHPVNDGAHTCSFDGERIPAPSLYWTGPLYHSQVTIVVEPAG
jgi:hypothetical protein